MNRSKIRTTLAVLCAACSAAVVADANLRCGSKIIVVGMTQAEVRAHCGEPLAEDVEDHDVRSGQRVVGRTAVHRWTYESGGATHVLVFDQDRLVSIE